MQNDTNPMQGSKIVIFMIRDNYNVLLAVGGELLLCVGVPPIVAVGQNTSFSIKVANK